MRLLPLIVGIFLLAIPARSWACSLGPESFSVTNFELVGLADAIVIATAVSETPQASGSLGSVTFRVEGALKGEGPELYTSDYAQLGQAWPSDPDNIAWATGTGGSCSRVTFEQGKRYVLFLVRNDAGEWRRTGPAHARDAEDYNGPGSLWVRAIELYVDVQQNPDRMAQRARLSELLPALEMPDASEADRSLAADIRRHLEALSPLTPTPVLLAAYEEMERGGPLSLPIDEFDRPAERQDEILLSLVLGDHPGAEPLFARILGDIPRDRSVGYAIRFLGKHDGVERAFEVIERDLYPLLAGLPDAIAFAWVSDIHRVMYGEWHHSRQDTPPWEQDPYIRARWPEMALSLYWDFSRRGSRFGRIDSAIEALRPNDYRDRPEVTLALAEAYDPDVEAWAIDEVARLLPAADWLDDEDPLWFPLQVLTFAFGEERDEALIRTFCSGETGRIMVVSQLGRHGDGLDDELLLQMLGEAAIDDEDRRAILTALIFSEARNDKGDGALLGSDLVDEIIPQVLRGEPVTRYGRPIAPLVCPTA